MNDVMVMNNIDKIIIQIRERIAHSEKLIDEEKDLDLFWAGHCTALDYVETCLISLLEDMKKGFI